VALTPSEIFIIYTQEVIQNELTRPHTIPLDVLERRLWDVAQFDSFIIHKNSKPLLDELGVPQNEGKDYAVIIETALREYKAGRRHSYDTRTRSNL
jgi:hypothetical protein